MVNIFIIVPNIQLTADMMDKKRIGKQRIEVKQIIDILEEIDKNGSSKSKSRVSHPAIKSWIGYTNHLKVYFNIIVRKWISYGFKNNYELYDIDERPYNIVPCIFDGKTASYDISKFNQYSFPFWVSFPPFYMSHQASLCRKDPLHYRGLLRDELKPFLNNGYFWPSNVSNEAYLNWNFSHHENLASGCPSVYKLTTIDVLKWLKNRLVNPTTNRKITKNSQIYIDYEKAMEKHKIVEQNGNIWIESQQIYPINQIDLNINMLINYYEKNDGIPPPDKLVYKFAGVNYFV